MEVEDNVNLSREELARKDKKFLKPTWVEYVFRLYMLGGVLYYIVDNIDVVFIRYGPALNYDICLWAMFMHHLLTVLISVWLMRIPHMPWSMGFPLAFHCVLIRWPEYFSLNWVYGAGVVAYMYTIFFVKPFKDSRIYRSVFIVTLPIIFPLLIIAAIPCSNDLV